MNSKVVHQHVACYLVLLGAAGEAPEDVEDTDVLAAADDFEVNTPLTISKRRLWPVLEYW